MIFNQINLMDIFSATLVLAGIIDIIGSVPIIIPLKEQGREVSPIKATLISLALLLGFFYGGDAVLQFFGVDIHSFAVAGALLIFLTALEMVLDVVIFHNLGPTKDATLIPLVFPLLAGAGAFTTLIALKVMYADINILIALLINMVWVYVVLRATDTVQRILGAGGIYFSRKFFGIVLLAISVRMFSDNIKQLFI